VSVIASKLSNWIWGKVISLILPGMLAAGLPLTALANFSANLTWQASPDPSVTSYRICYGGTSQQYTNTLAVGAVTNTLISGLDENTTYYFAAKAVNQAGGESAFSNEAMFLGVTTAPEATLRLNVLPNNTNPDPLLFSAGPGTPVEATIDPVQGIIQWTPGQTYASTTNYMTIYITDQANPGLSTSETLVVVVGDYVRFQWGAAAVSAGQTGTLSLTMVASDSVSNAQITVAWPDSSLLNPTLTVLPPVIAGTLQHQNNQLVIQLQTDPNQPLTGTNLVAQVSFQTSAGQPSAIYSLAAVTSSANTATGPADANLSANSTEVAVVGAQSLLRPQSDAINGRSLSLYAQPGAYVLQYATSLAAPVAWTTLRTYQQTNLVQAVSLDSDQPVIFYRLQQL
jgi:hypothetical protein